MSTNTAALIELATSRLKIRNITLHESNLSRPTELEAPETQVAVMEKRAVRAAKAEAQIDGKSLDLLLVFVDLGIRMVHASMPEGAEPHVYVQIEATFLVEYELLEELPEEAVNAFAESNSVHNVWPFWRQHVFDTVQRGALPHIDVPFFTVSKPRTTKSTDVGEASRPIVRDAP